jgi:hypothetical protein
VSYSLAIAGDARADLRTLEPWLQEEVLDELEIIAQDPTVLPESEPDTAIVYAFSRQVGIIRHYVGLVLLRNEAGQSLTLLGVSHRITGQTGQEE